MEDYRLFLDKLNMMPHPEGGFYRRNWQSLLTGDLRDGTGKTLFPNRLIGSSILYLLPHTMVCKWHRVKCDEMWHHYEGTPLTLYLLTAQKGLETITLGHDFKAGQNPQFIVPRLTWFAAELAEPSGYAFCGCTLWPAFSYTDFEMAEPDSLADDFPAHAELIRRIQNHPQ
ncbi:MAG TPA: cupin domain-containing protein [Candidatus Syntrophosphaera sp.]|nr:cupin domain-containing protein [Candidatus Syntrophosphaera sp.]